MDVISSLGDTIKGGGSTVDDDWVDRLSRLWSVGIFVLFAVIVTTGTYVGDPINCWCPAYFTSNYVSYTQKICWVSNTYYIPIDDDIPDNDLLKPQLTYYQWTPFILLFQAALFYVPCLFWRAMNERAGLSLSDIIQSGKDFQKAANFQERGTTVEYMARHMDRFLDLRGRRSHHPGLRGRVLDTCMCCACQRNRGNYLIFLFLMTKVLYLINAISQLFMLSRILDEPFYLYGFEVLGRILRGEEWMGSPHFPRNTLCDFQVRQLGNTHRHTVQCVLPINLFNEVIFTLIWFWLVFVATMTAWSILTWTIRTFITRDRVRYCKRHIKLLSQLSGESDRKLLVQFVNNYLKEDGLFILQLISKNASDIIVSEVVHALWEKYKDFRPQPERNMTELDLDGDHKPPIPV